MGDSQAHDQFLHDFLTHRRMLHAFILSLTSDYAVAEDIFQEVSTVLWRKYENYTQGTNFGAWAREVAYREVLSTRKKLSRGSSRASGGSGSEASSPSALPWSSETTRTACRAVPLSSRLYAALVAIV